MYVVVEWDFRIDTRNYCGNIRKKKQCPIISVEDNTSNKVEYFSLKAYNPI